MFKWRFVKDLLLHRLTAGNRHGLHSPFVYRLVDKVIYDFKPKKVYAGIENYRKQLLHDGSGHSKQSRSATDQLICRLAADMQPKSIVQIGRSSEISNMYLKAAAPNAKFCSLDSVPNPGELPLLDLALIDSIDEQQTMLDYFKMCLPKVHENSLLIFIDIYKNESMKQAWKQIKAHPDVTATVDLFWIGLVYFKKGRVKENFKIRL